MPEPSIGTSGSFQNRKTIIAAFAFIAAIITFIAYIPALNNGFVNWDDQGYVYENRFIRSLDLRFFKWAATAVVNANWHPLTVLSHAIDYSIWGLNPWGHHLTSIIFHVLNTFLVAIIATRLSVLALDQKPGGDKTAVFTGIVTALLFGLHPLHVESVAWVSERKDVLSAFFFLLSVLGYLKYTSQKKAFYYLTAFCSFILALLSKPMAITLPVVLLILDWYPLNRFESEGVKKPIAEKIPFLMLSALSAALTIWAQKAGGALVSIEEYPLIERIPVALRSFIFYLYKMVLPLGLAPYYPYPTLSKAGFFILWVMAPIALLTAVSVFCVLTLKRRKNFSAVWLYYIVTLTPVIGIVQVGTQAAADRYTYLPSLGPFMLVGAGLSYILEKSGKKRFALSSAAATVIIAAVLSVLTVKQEFIWRDSITLWSHEIKEFPQVFISYNGRGTAYRERGLYKEAIEDFSAAISIKPEYVNAYTNRGVIYQELGYFREAIADFDNAIRLNPAHASAYNNRGIVHERLGEYSEAIKDYSKSIELNPENALAYYNLGIVYGEAGNQEMAMMNFKKAAGLGLKEAQVYLNKPGIYR